MAKTILYIAMSLDGYIADETGSVGWLEGDGSDPKNIGSYSEFFENIGTIILGYGTYNQIITELSKDIWPYEGKKSYVLTHKKLESRDDIIFTDQSLSSLIEKLKISEEKDIWICGGASIANQLIEKNLIDLYSIAIIPTILGNGIHLFNKQNSQHKLELIQSKNYNGIVEVMYKPRTDSKV